MLAFCNSYPERLWVAYMFWSPNDCGGEGGDWQTIGWFPIEPGACVTVYANDLDDVNNRYWYSTRKMTQLRSSGQGLFRRTSRMKRSIIAGPSVRRLGESSGIDRSMSVTTTTLP